MTVAIRQPVYQIDKNASRFSVRAFASGMLSAMGHSPTIAIRDFTGEAVFTPDDPEKCSLTLRIQAGSLDITDDISSQDRREMERGMFQDVLEIAKYPEIEYQSTAVDVSPALLPGSCDTPGTRDATAPTS